MDNSLHKSMMIKNRFLSFLLITLFSILAYSNQSFAQTTGDVGIGTTTPYVNAALHVSSTTKGLMIPKLTAAQRTTLENKFVTTADKTAANGLMIYNTTTSRFNYWNGITWSDVGSGAGLNGTQWFVGSGLPPGGLAPNTSALGNPGDYFLDGVGGNVYKKELNNTWVLLRTTTNAPVNLKGSIKTVSSLATFNLTAGSSSTQTFNISGALVGAGITVSPEIALPDGIIIAYARVAATGIVEVKFTNVTGGVVNVPASSYSVVVVN